jgi:putative membrane protein
MKNLKKSILKNCLLVAMVLVGSIHLHAQTTIKLTDPEIASVAVTANQIDVEYADIAQKKSKNADIKKFAQTMKDDHTAVIGLAVNLVKKLNVTPKDNALTKSLLDGAKETKVVLNKKAGKAFDKAYVDNEVAYHKAVIDAVAKVLIPQAKNAELKALLEKVLPTLKMHLKHAEMIQMKFK